MVLIRKALYGLASSASAWWDHLATSLRNIGFTNTSVDNDVWLKKIYDKNSNLIGYDYICVHVDDFCVIGRDPHKYISALQKVYDIRHITPLNVGSDTTYYLGMDIRRLPYGKRGFRLAAKTYLKESFLEVERLIGKSLPKQKVPMPPNANYEVPSTPICNANEHQLYRKLVGMLQWISELGRIDITYSARFLARYTASPLRQHLDGCLHVFGYLKQYPHFSLPIDASPMTSEEGTPIEIANVEGELAWLRKLYPTATEEISPSDPEPFWTGIPIKCYVDADWAGDLSMRRSVSGYIIYFGSTPIIWSSKAQSRVESSTYSSEFTALKSALEEIKGVRIALRAFGVEVSEPTIVMCDNRSVVSNNVIAASTLKKRHVGIAYHMCREAVASNIICVHHLLSRHNRADILTKSLASPTLHEHNSNIFRTGCDDLI